jgi:hypothetical protein
MISLKSELVMKVFPFQFDDGHPVCNVFTAAGDRWRNMRAIMNPTFSFAKLREVSKLINRNFS